VAAPVALQNLESIAAFGIALNLTYLNLPNLRFADRIKNKIRLVISGYHESAYSHVETNDPGYKSIFVAGELNDLAAIKKPTGEAYSDGSMWVQIFMGMWCTPVWTGHGTVPVDKVIASILLVVSSLYIFVIAAIKVQADFDVLTNMLIIFVVLPIMGILIAFGYRRDWANLAIASLVTLYGLYCIYSDRSALRVEDPQHALVLLVLCVAVTTLLSLSSFALYQTAEKHYTNEVKRLFDAATKKVPSADKKAAN